MAATGNGWLASYMYFGLESVKVCWCGPKCPNLSGKVENGANSSKLGILERYLVPLVRIMTLCARLLAQDLLCQTFQYQFLNLSI